MADSTGYWTFFCKPAKYDIDDFLVTNREYGLYRVRDWHESLLKPGQLGVLRVGIDNRKKERLKNKPKLNPGIYAIVQILDVPKISVDYDDSTAFYPNKEEAGEESLRVKIRYLKNLLDKPLLLTDLKGNVIIKHDKYLIDGFQSATMPLEKDAFDEIINLLDASDQMFNNIELENSDTIDEITLLELKYKDATPQVKEVISRRIERGKISSLVKKLNNYKCQVCEALGNNPYSFKKIDGVHYIETHHINQVSNLTQGSLGYLNLLTVCANHHRQFHYGNITTGNNTRNELNIVINGENIKLKKKNFLY
jgi:hypothetical protein